MSTTFALIALGIAWALIMSAWLTIPRSRSAQRAAVSPTSASGRVESELLRRPLRSHHGV